MRCTWDDFSNFTSHPSSVTKCPLHHTKVLTWGACKMTFQISPCIHRAWPSTPKFSHEVDTRWLFKCHLATMRDDIWKVYKGKILQIFIIWPWDIEEVTSNSKVLMWGGCKMTFQMSPHIHVRWNWKVYKGKILQIFIIWPWDIKEVTSNSKVLMWGECEMTFQMSPRIHLAWPSVSSTKVHAKMTFQILPHIHLAWPSTPKFSCEMDARWLFKCHLTSMWDDIWKVYKGKILQIFIIWPWDIEEVTSNSKVLMQGAHEMTFQILPHVHLVWPSTPKFSCEVDVRWLFKSHLTSI